MTALTPFRTLVACALVVAGAQNAMALTGGADLPFTQERAGEPLFDIGSTNAAGANASRFERIAQADCSAAAAQAAAQTGGQVLSVSASNQGGQTVCVVTVLIPGQGGERPRRTTITIPG